MKGMRSYILVERKGALSNKITFNVLSSMNDVREKWWWWWCVWYESCMNAVKYFSLRGREGGIKSWHRRHACVGACMMCGRVAISRKEMFVYTWYEIRALACLAYFKLMFRCGMPNVALSRWDKVCRKKFDAAGRHAFVWRGSNVNLKIRGINK